MLFKGLFTALATPFKDNKIDLLSFERLISRQLSAGVDGFVINGTTGESPTVDIVEAEALYRMARKLIGRERPLLLGTGSNSTASTIKATQWAKDLGADAALIVTPYYNKPPQRGLIDHFTAVADNVDLPIVLYNVPSRTIARLEVETILKLSSHPRIVGLKEASGDIEILKRLKSGVPKDFSLLSGDDDTCVRFCAEGGHGVISVTSHLIPDEMKRILESAGRLGLVADKEYRRFANLNRLLFIEANPIPLKAALKYLGIFTSGELRLPLVEMDETLGKELVDELKNLGLRKVLL
jgi:4-hydroxy-tetrahydrodipicolinate synthase